MKLHEAIQKVLRENGHPMTAMDIADSINLSGYYEKADATPLQSSQVYARVKNYPSILQNINGHIVLVEDNHWKNLLTSYEYLSNTLKGIFILADIQFIIAVLLFYKRFIDINDRPGRSYPLKPNGESKSTLDDLIDGGRSFVEKLKSLEDYSIAPEGVFEECARLLIKLDNFKRKEIASILNQIHTRHLSDQEFGNIYEYLLTIVYIDSDKSSLNHTPYSLRQLMVAILNPTENTSVYDPVAGIGGLLIEAKLHENVSIQGSEINKRIAQLGNLNLLVHGMGSVNDIRSEDCFEQINEGRKYDFIIADLPANGITNSVEHAMLYNQYRLSIPQSGKSFGSLVLFALSKLNDNGKAVLTVSDGFLVKKGKEKEIRDLLIEQDVIESIISLPYGTLRPYTDAKASILVLNKNKPNQLTNRIQFITAKAEDQSVKSLILNNDEVIQQYNDKIVLSKNAQIVAYDDLRSDTNLSADAYDAQFLIGNIMLKEERGRLLGDIAQIKAGVSPEKSLIHREGDIPLIKVENLSKDILDINLDISNTGWLSSGYRYERNIVARECILVARIGDNLKPTIFRPTDEVPVILPHSNVYALTISHWSELNIEYLYYQFHATFIQEQIEKRKLGTVMPYVSIAGLKEVIVPYMSIEAQVEFVQSQKANLIAEERQRVEDRILALGYKEETKQAGADVIKTLTHQLRPVFTGINSITQRIDRIVRRENLADLKEYENLDVPIDSEIEQDIAQPDNFTLGQLLEKLSGETNHLSNVLTNVDKVMNFTLLPEDLKEVNILNFLNQYKTQKDIEQNGLYTIKVKGEAAHVLLHEASFKELLDQLLRNAEKHAFANKNDDEENQVQFIVKRHKTRGVVTIEYSNNGAPYELTQKDFVTAFEKGNKSTGSGIGGNYISRIVAAHAGALILESNYSEGFLLNIELPIINKQQS